MTSPLKKPRRSVTATRRAPPRSTTTRRPSASKESKIAPEPLVISDDGQDLFQQGIILPHHKRQLILAHAQARQARHMPHRWVYLMGVAASCLIVMVGWWMTVGTWIKGQIMYASQPGIQQDVRENIGRLESVYPVATPQIAGAKELLNPTAATATPTTVDKTSSR